jgi:transposase-like protein
VDWKKIKAEYIAGGTSYRKLCEKYGVPFGTLRRKAKQEGWTQKREQVEHNVDTSVLKSVSQKETQNALGIVDVADKLLDKIAEMLAADVTNAQSVKSLTSALKDLKEIKGYKSEADIREQEARIAKLRREAGLGDDEEDGGGVIVLPDAVAPLIDEENVGE